MQWLERPRPSAAALARTGWANFATVLYGLSRHQKKIAEIAQVMRRRRHAVFGCHARNSYIAHDARVTSDIDLLVPDAEAAKRAGNAIARQVAGVELRATPFGMVQVLDRRSRDKIADLVPADEPITMAAIATAKRREVPLLGFLRVPPREILIAMKLDSASNPRRYRGRAQIDLGDAMFMHDEEGLDHRALDAALDLVPSRARAAYRKNFPKSRRQSR